MKYPRKVVLEDEKLKKLLTEKGELIKKGRKISEDIEEYEKEMEKIDVDIQEIEKTVDISDLNTEAEDVTNRMKAMMKEMEGLQAKIFARMKEKVPTVVTDRYEEVKKLKEKAETERNKIALKAQKYNDKMIPLARKLMAKHLEDKYEDYNSLVVENGQVVGTIFSHLEEWKDLFDKKFDKKA